MLRRSYICLLAVAALSPSLQAAQGNSRDYHILVPMLNDSLTARDAGPEPLTSMAPAPGALLLGSLGAGLLSWLRTRKVL